MGRKRAYLRYDERRPRGTIVKRKAKRGRPRSQNPTRTARLDLRLMPAERAEIEADARAHSMTLAEYVRWRLGLRRE